MMDCEFKISIPTDVDGYILLRCEHCGTFFKASPEDVNDDSVLHLFCPSCGLICNHCFTEDVIALATDIMENRVNDLIHSSLKELERYGKKGGMKFKVTRKPQSQPEEPIRSGIEAMEVASFSCCSRMAKIKPLLKMTGSYCPFCGVKNYEIE